jgi:FMN phosphatase YigB (HAD superfamily)
MQAKAVFFDAANTLLYKPGLYPAIRAVFANHGVAVPDKILLAAHRFLSEVVLFPDQTSSSFYRDFNSHLIRSFGVIPTDELLDALFAACTYLPWEPFPDTDFLSSLTLPLGVLSNWDTSLPSKLSLISDARFEWILGSAEQQIRKPNPGFFKKIVEVTGLNAEEIVYIGDSMRLDIEPALYFGMNALLIDRENLYPYSTVPRIKSLYELGRLL